MSEGSHTLVRKRSPAWKRWAKRAAIGLAFLFLLGFFAYSVILLRAGRRIRRELQAVKAANEPLNWEELLRTDREGHVLPKGRDFSSSAISQLYAEALSEAKGWSQTKGHELYSALRDGNITNADLEVLGAALREYRKALELLRQAASHEGIAILPDSKVEPDQAMMDQLADMREGGRLLVAQALYVAAQGRGDEAADWCIVLCRFAHAFPGNNLISGLVRFAITSVAWHAIQRTQNLAPASAEKVSELIAAVSDLEEETPLARMLCGERVLGSHLCHSGAAGGGISPASGHTA